MSLKPFIKVPLVLLENLFFSFFPKARPVIEKYIFNPLDFKEKHNEYAIKKYDEFCEFFNSHSNIRNKNILELGPGGSIGFGILALEDGARNYFALDDGNHSFVDARHRKQYLNLLKNNVESLKNYIIHSSSGYVYSSKISFTKITQDSKYPLEDSSIDIIYSCAVLEHVHDLDLCFYEMSRVLKEGGFMYHEVDLRDHIFSQKSLWFLKINDYWFRKLFSHTGGYVNRKRFSEYKQLAKKYNLVVLSLETGRITEASGSILHQGKLSKEDREIFTFKVLLRKEKNHALLG